MKLSNEEFSQKYVLKYEKLFEVVYMIYFLAFYFSGHDEVAIDGFLAKETNVDEFSKSGYTYTLIQTDTFLNN